MSLQHLAPELLILILQSIASPRDLHALISASSRCLRAFNVSPERTLAAVLTNAIAPEAYHDALAVAHAPPGPYFQDEADLELLMSHAKLYFDGDLPAFPLERSRLVSLFRLHRQVLRFSQDYAEQAARIINETPCNSTSPSSEQWLPLTSSERGRFERAFYRHELYCRLHPRDRSGGWDSVLCAEEQNENFLRYLLPWEAEELVCVHHYFYRIVERYLTELDNQFCEAVLSAPGVKPCGRTSRSSKTMITINHRFEQDMDHEMELFDRDEWFEAYRDTTGFIAAEGLAMMSRLAAADKDTRRRLLRSHSTCHREFLHEALRVADESISDAPFHPIPLRMRLPLDSRRGVEDGYRQLQTEDGEGMEIWLTDAECEGVTLWMTQSESEGDNWWSGTHGYREWSEYGGVQFPLLHTDTDDPCGVLRDMAYVFWDAERISIPRVTEAMTTAQDYDSRDVKDRYDRERGMSARQRLKGMKLPRDELEKIEQTFGSNAFSRVLSEHSTFNHLQGARA